MNICYFTDDSNLLWTPSYLTHSWFITIQLLFLHPSWDAALPSALHCAPLLLTSASFFVLISSAASPSASPLYTGFIKCLVVGILILARLSLQVESQGQGCEQMDFSHVNIH